ncbi:hypothetical protein CFC21_064079 [Triticum aestivum]|uniref:Uncharacterized protein n=2 Tax=Triticum aestivum TaxID=4565 RepID=A0A9R1H0P3_WHEAT|nr:hypothetical protein CFC21_064079 [Triticum aestivum]
MAGVQPDLLGNSNKGGRGDKGGDDNQQSNEIAKSLIPMAQRNWEADYGHDVSALLHVHGDSASIVEHDLASRELTLLGQPDKHYKHRCCQGWGFLSTPLNASATTSRSDSPSDVPKRAPNEESAKGTTRKDDAGNL